MKTLFSVPLIVLIVYVSSNAQCLDCSAGNNLNISTGIDPMTGELLGIGTVDPAWQLMNFPPLTSYSNTSIDVPNANVIFGYNNWLNLNGCNPGPCGILSPDVNYYLPGNTYPDQPWRFRRYFCVCGTADKIVLTGSARMDDAGRLTVYDMEGNAVSSTVEMGSCLYTDCNLNMVLNLTPGTYYVEVEVENLGAALFGFVIDAMLETDENILANVNANCCNDTHLGFITLQKILETEKCNGQIDDGEQPGAGWVFDLLNSSGQIIQTQTTDANGELTFSGLADGNYMVAEQPQDGWFHYPPNVEAQQVEVVDGGGAMLTFFNCAEGMDYVPEKECCPELRNLITNAGFEKGNYGFTSQYQPDGSSPSTNSLMPGEYGVFPYEQLADICPSWESGAPSSCHFAENILVVNGATGQSSGKKLIWEQVVPNIQPWKQYRFCAKFKHLATCCFDVTPKVDIKFSIGASDILDEEIEVTADNSCGWKMITQNINSQDSPGDLTIQIWLDETTPGDGNDLAIDDVSLKELPKMEDQFTEFSLNPLQTGDGQYQLTATATAPLPAEEGCDGVWSIIAIDANGEEHEIYNASNWWIDGYSNSTNFPGYDGQITYTNNNQVISGPGVSEADGPGLFSEGVTYLIKRGVYCDCRGWNEYSTGAILEKRGRYIEIREAGTKRLLKRTRFRRSLFRR